ncbi:MAG: SpoIIE family protein phosphatase [Methanobrevibacter arboriphilus]|nr:SpoIIE family protein phosphatase [Methanobrevibacter arboriphilus]
MIFCSLIYILIAVPFRYFFPILYVSELRPASALPPVFGMLFGPWGALGAAIGNMVADIIAGYPPEIYILGFIAQFFYGYISYKLWYGLKITDKITPPRINNVKSLIKFIIVILIASTVMSILLGLLLESLNIANIASPSTLMFEFNNFDFSMILGVLIINLANFYNIKMYKPKKSKKSYLSPKLSDISLILATIIGISYAIYSLFMPPISNNYIITLIVYILVFIYLLRPITEKIEDKISFIKISLTEKIISFFLIIGAIMAILTGIVAFYTDPTSISNTSEFWGIIYINISVVLIIFYIMSVLFLWYIEKNITTPIESISEITDDYTNDDDNIENSEKIISEIKNFTEDKGEIGILANSLEKMIINLENYMEKLRKVTSEKERINTELDIAKKIQESILPNKFPAFPNKVEFDVYAMSKSAEKVGGDFYDFFLIDENHLAIVIADVSDKGIPAALFMMIAKTLIKSNLLNENTPDEAFFNANNQLCEDNDQNMFVTAWMGVLEIDTGKFTFVNAGHNPPILKDNEKSVWLKSSPGFVLGGIKDIKYLQNKITLKPGDRLLLYTDGVTEAINNKEEFFGEKRLIETFDKKGDSQIKEVLDSIKDDIDLFAGDIDQFDDITMLILEYKKE